MFYGYKLFNVPKSHFVDYGPRETFILMCILLPIKGIGIYLDFVLSLSVDKDVTQKADMITLAYEIVQEGLSHEPVFRSTVIVNGVRYDYLPCFFNRKTAEQSVAEIALLELMKSDDSQLAPSPSESRSWSYTDHNISLGEPSSEGHRSAGQPHIAQQKVSQGEVGGIAPIHDVVSRPCHSAASVCPRADGVVILTIVQGAQSKITRPRCPVGGIDHATNEASTCSLVRVVWRRCYGLPDGSVIPTPVLSNRDHGLHIDVAGVERHPSTGSGNRGGRPSNLPEACGCSRKADQSCRQSLASQEWATMAKDTL
ncbi:NAD(P)H-quinone oxidoreductase chain 4 [Nymphaea thermarum]|nr:NAD(P)H-quinone oxidoreductase chain 4 [Nymphaea thermarum]